MLATVHDESLLILIIDTDRKFWFDQEKLKSENANILNFKELTESLLVFVNSYLLLHRKNRLAIIAADHGTSEFLYPMASSKDTTGLSEQFGNVGRAVVSRLKELASNTIDNSSSELSNMGMSSAFSRGLCYINRIIGEVEKIQPRILIIQGSSDVSEQHIPIMNCIFSAQKQNIPVDSCILSNTPSTFLQQASYLTQGIYFQPEQQNGFLQYLISMWLPDLQTRKHLSLPRQFSVDFRAVCFCHKKATSIAYVCPVCLSVFCEFKPVCSTCGVRSLVKSKRVAISKTATTPSSNLS